MLKGFSINKTIHLGDHCKAIQHVGLISTPWESDLVPPATAPARKPVMNWAIRKLELLLEQLPCTTSWFQRRKLPALIGIRLVENASLLSKCIGGVKERLASDWSIARFCISNGELCLDSWLMSSDIVTPLIYRSSDMAKENSPFITCFFTIRSWTIFPTFFPSRHPEFPRASTADESDPGWKIWSCRHQQLCGAPNCHAGRFVPGCVPNHLPDEKKNTSGWLVQSQK